MAHYDDQTNTVVHWPNELCSDYLGWETIDCGCCAGIQWGGYEPIECNRCEGAGILFHHIKSGVLALYPGGPLRGKL